jgi:hypothetical protein
LWTALRGAGLPIVSSWLDAALNRGEAATSEAWGEHWSRCIAESTSADLVLFHAPAPHTQCGALIEIGAALGAGREVWIVSDYEWSFAHLPRCRIFPTIESAIEAIVARMAGERLRQRERVHHGARNQ